MKKGLGLILLLLLSFIAKSQGDSVKVYSWEEVINADPDTIVGITFSKLKLDSLPGELERFTNVWYLNLEKNKLSNIPDYFRSFESLVWLDLGKNKLDHFPVQLCSMSQLTHLIINRNQIEIIPECIGRISTLEYLDLYDNPIRQLPETMVSLENLKEIDFSGIRFSPTFQKHWKSRLPEVKLVFDAPCDCME